MGSLKDEFLENQEFESIKKQADYLEITVDEFEEVGAELHDNLNSDDAVVGHYFEFKDDAPKEILDKIKGRGEDGFVWVLLDELDSNSDDEDDFAEGNIGGVFMDSPPAITQLMVDEARKRRDEDNEK